MIWRRRILALLVLLALVVGVVLGVGALVRMLSAQGAETLEAGSTPADEQTGPVDPGPCTPADMDATVSTEAGTAGEPVTFALTLTNAGDAACLVDAGSAALVLTVHSGDDRVWSSGDCAAEPTVRELLLDAGDATETTLTWKGSRSAAGCPSGQGAATAGTYRVQTSLDGAALDGAREVFTLG